VQEIGRPKRMEKHEPEKRQEYAPESTQQKQTKNAMDVSTPSPKRISRTDAKFNNAQGETSERKG
jgi:LAS superfamily LD-carboxypeptidase LdcB